MTVDFGVSRRALSLGTADTKTGWFAKNFAADETIDMVIVPKGFTFKDLSIGVYAQYTLTGYNLDPVAEGDEIKSVLNKHYEIISVEPVDWGDSHVYDVCELHKVYPHYDMPTTYGTGASVDDPRYRTKDLLDGTTDPTTALSNANLLENDGVTQASFITAWANPPYPIYKVFVTKDIDLIYSIGRGETSPIMGHDHYATGYNDRILITISTIDKTGITGENLMWQGERELRRVTETYPLGSLRNLETMRPKTQTLGSTTLYSVECALDYRRGKT